MGNSEASTSPEQGSRTAFRVAVPPSDSLYRDIFETAIDVIYTSDMAGTITTVNSSITRISGYAAEELVGRNVADLLTVESRERAGKMLELKLERGGVTDYEVDLVTRDGRVAPIEVRTHLLYDLGQPTGIVGFVRDLSERRRTEKALKESEARYRLLVESFHDVVFITDYASRMLYANPALERQTGYTAADFQFPQAENPFIHPDEAARVAEFIGEFVAGPRQHSSIIENRFIDKRGRTHWYSSVISKIEYDGQPALQFITRDITEHKEAEERLRFTQKLESIGVLAGGIAHDFNNLLAGILGQASLASAKLAPQGEIRAHIEKVMSGARRAADLTRQLLAYAGRGQFSFTLLDLNRAISENAGLLETAVPKGVTFACNLARNLPPIRADRGQIDQLVMNLVINAAEAIPGEDGRIDVETGLCRLEDGGEHFLGAGQLPAGSYLVLQVADTGTGMGAETLARIFDPFFTTKPAGRGLGLSATLGIVRAHGGGLSVTSSPGKGTTFRVLLPAVEAVLDETRSEAGSVSLAGRSILVVDDEPHVRETLSEMLGAAGIAVATASNGRQAVALFDQAEKRFDAVILDWQMPVMGGEQTLNLLHQSDPSVRVLVSTGGYGNGDVLPGVPDGCNVLFLQKPFTTAELLEKIRELVSNSSQAS